MSKVQLSQALTILARAEASELFAHDEVDAYYAPSECHTLVMRGEAKRWRLTRKRAESAARAPLRVILREAHKRGGLVPCSGDPKWQRFVARVYRNYCF